MNVIGAVFACLASVMIHYLPFIVLEGAWALVSMATLLKEQAGVGCAMRPAASLSVRETRQDAHHAVLARAHVDVLPINNRVADVYFHLVRSGRDAENLRTVVDCRGLSCLQAVHEHD